MPEDEKFNPKNVKLWKESVREAKDEMKELRDISAVLNNQQEGMTKSQQKQSRNMSVLLDATMKATRQGKITLKQTQDRAELIQDIAKGEMDLSSVKNKAKSIEDEIIKIRRRYRGVNKGIGEQQVQELKKNKLLLDAETNRLGAQELSNQALSGADSLTGGMVGKGKELMGAMDGFPTPFKVASIGLTAMVAIMSSFNEKLEAMGKAFGAAAVQSGQLRDNILESEAQVKALGGSIDDVVGITNNLSNNFAFSQEQAAALSAGILDTSKALGMSNDEVGNFVGQMEGITGMGAEQSQEYMKHVTLFARANNVAPQQVLRDMAASAETMAKWTDATGKNLARAAVQARKFGLNMDTIANAARGTLNYSEQIEKAQRAEALLGRRINTSRMQRFALEKNLEGVMEEQRKILQQGGDFTKLSVFEQEALAEAVGLTVDQAAKMVSKQEEAVSLSGELGKQPGFEDLVGKEALSSMAQLMGSIKSIGASLVNVLGPALNAVLKPIALVFKGIGGLVNIINEYIGVIPVIVAGLIAYKGATMATIAVTKAKAAWDKRSLVWTAASAVANFFKGASLGSTATLGFGTPALVAMAVLAAAAIFKGVQKAKGMAEGGIVTARPGGMPAIIGEGGEDEAVIPLSKMDQMTGGGGNLDTQAIVGAINSLKTAQQSQAIPMAPQPVEQVQPQVITTETPEGTPTNVGDSLKPIIDAVVALQQESIGLRQDMEGYFGFGGTASAQRIGRETLKGMEGV